MIRRLLIMRLRRHTRLARALAGRAPLASRAAVDQPLLWAVGRAPVPPRRARAPVFLEAALRTIAQAGVTPPPDQLPVMAAGSDDQSSMPATDVFAGPPVPDTLPTPPSAMPAAAGPADLHEPAVTRSARDLRMSSGDELPEMSAPLVAEDERLVEERIVTPSGAPPATGAPRAAGAGAGERSVAASGAPPATGAPRAAGAGAGEQSVAASGAAPADGGQHVAGAGAGERLITAAGSASVEEMRRPAEIESDERSVAASGAPPATGAPRAAGAGAGEQSGAAAGSASVEEMRRPAEIESDERSVAASGAAPAAGAPRAAGAGAGEQSGAAAGSTSVEEMRRPAEIESDERSVAASGAAPADGGQHVAAASPDERSVAVPGALSAASQRAADTTAMPGEAVDFHAAAAGVPSALPGDIQVSARAGADVPPKMPEDSAPGDSAADAPSAERFPSEGAAPPVQTTRSTAATTPDGAAAFDPVAWMKRLRATDQQHRQDAMGLSRSVEEDAPVSQTSSIPGDRAPSKPRSESAEAGVAQPADPAAAIVDAARAWVAQRKMERSSPPVEQPAASPPVPPKTQPQPSAPVEIRVARPPRFVEERAQRSTPPPNPAPAAETPRETDQPPAGTPAFDRSVEAWMERLRADERRRRQKEMAASAPDRSPEEATRPEASVPPVMPAQPSGAPWTSDAPGTTPGREQQLSGSQPAGADQSGVTASPLRPTRFVPPVRAAVRAAASSSRPFPVRSVPSPLPLADSNRRFLRAAVGVDPASARIDRGPEAGRVAAAYRADAVTTGDDVALAPGRGDETAEGLGLLAHELTHVARRRDPVSVPPILRPPEQRPGLRPAPPGSATDEEALARTVEAQTIQAARMRFAPPVLPASTGAATAPPVRMPEPVRTIAPVEDAPVAPDRARWGNLPAPWEPLPDWLAPSRPTTETPPLPVVTVAPAPPALTTPPQPGAPVIQTAETARTLPTVRQTETTTPVQEQAPAPDLDELARQVYAVLKRRLAAERRRNGW